MIQRPLAWMLTVWFLLGCSNDRDMGPAELAPPAGDPDDGAAGPRGSQPADTPAQDDVAPGTPGEAGGGAPAVPVAAAGPPRPDASTAGPGAVGNTKERAQWTRSSRRLRLPTTNSSPPHRPTASSGRTASRSLPATSTRTWAPTSCPWLALTALKPARSAWVS